MSKVLDYIAKDIQSRMTRLGIVADFKAVEAQDDMGQTYTKFVSSNFIMQPMIFKDIHAEGRIWVEDYAKYPDCKLITVQVELKWNHWDGGSNGMRYGSFQYCIDNELYANDEAQYVESVKGFEI